MTSAEIARMFSRIASRYDLANRILSFSLDRSWRRRVVHLAKPQPGERGLDVCTGTADLLVGFAHQRKQLALFGVDLSREMLRIGQEKLKARGGFCASLLIEADALCLPFASETFDLVTIAFGLRNLPDVPAGILELVRVLRPGGRLLILEFALPPNALFRRLYLFYLRHLVPRVGALIAGSREAYDYLSRSIREFPSPKEIQEHLQRSGLGGVECYSLTGGIARVYRGERLY